ncbi:hypothetical protein GCM10027448_36960 [Nocardioides dilutus]
MDGIDRTARRGRPSLGVGPAGSAPEGDMGFGTGTGTLLGAGAAPVDLAAVVGVGSARGPAIAAQP